MGLGFASIVLAFRLIPMSTTPMSWLHLMVSIYLAWYVELFGLLSWKAEIFNKLRLFKSAPKLPSRSFSCWFTEKRQKVKVICLLLLWLLCSIHPNNAAYKIIKESKTQQYNDVAKIGTLSQWAVYTFLLYFHQLSIYSILIKLHSVCL